MKEETLRQKQIFDIYYSLGDNRSFQKLIETLKNIPEYTNNIPSIATLKSWSRKYNWQLRIQQRDREISKDLQKQIDKDIIDEKAEHRKLIKSIIETLKKSLEKYEERIKQEGKIVEIRSVRDLKEISFMIDTLIKLDLNLIGENIEPINIVISPELLPDKFKNESS